VHKMLLIGMLLIVQGLPFNKDALCYGDSIAVGYCRGMQGYQKGGSNPRQVLSYLKHDVNKFYGKDIVVSTGVSNNRKDFASIESQFALLHTSGARSITILGPAKGRYDTENVRILRLCDIYGFKCLGAFTPSSDKVHPRTYKRYE